MKKYIITSTIGLVIAILIALSKDVFGQSELKNVHHILCDAFFVSGTCITCYGLLVFSSNEGTFDMLVYGVKKFVGLFKDKTYTEKHKTFYDYKQALGEKKISFAYLIYVGLALIGISMIFLLAYYNL
jgi:hypothetical protein